jgi:hypothetical protein
VWATFGISSLSACVSFLDPSIRFVHFVCSRIRGILGFKNASGDDPHSTHIHTCAIKLVLVSAWHTFEGISILIDLSETTLRIPRGKENRSALVAACTSFWTIGRVLYWLKILNYCSVEQRTPYSQLVWFNQRQRTVLQPLKSRCRAL